MHADDSLTDDLGTRHWLGYPFGVFQLRLALRVVPQLLSVALLFCLSACAWTFGSREAKAPLTQDVPP